MMSALVALTLVLQVTPAAAGHPGQIVDRCQYRPSADEASRNHRDGLIVPDEPFIERCPPRYRPVYRSGGGLY